MAYYNRNYEKQLLMQQKYSDLVREQKEKASMERKTKVNINELEGVNDFKYSRDPNKIPDSLFFGKKSPLFALKPFMGPLRLKKFGYFKLKQI